MYNGPKAEPRHKSSAPRPMASSLASSSVMPKNNGSGTNLLRAKGDGRRMNRTVCTDRLGPLRACAECVLPPPMPANCPHAVGCLALSRLSSSSRNSADRASFPDAMRVCSALPLFQRLCVGLRSMSRTPLKRSSSQRTALLP